MKSYNNFKMPVYFYLPEKKNIVFPESINAFWEWISKTEGLSNWWGRYHWVLQTYLNFKKYGLNCVLTRELPDEGIIFSHRDNFPLSYTSNKYHYIVCMLVDRTTPLPYANFHILHNPVECLKFHRSYQYIPPWPQISLIPRSQERGNIFTTVGYLGYQENCDPMLRSKDFLNFLSKNNFNLYIPTPDKWNDFSKIDVIIGIRNFGKRNFHINKPSLKLYNAWLAGVPAILGYESAYRKEGNPSVDYLEASSYSEVVEHLLQLKENILLRQRIVKNGSEKANEFKAEKTVECWVRLINDVLIPDYLQWRKSVFKRRLFQVKARIRDSLTWRFNSLVINKIDIIS